MGAYLRFLREERERFSIVYHGTSKKDAENIIKNGVDIQYASGGYFGWGFYTTPDASLAKSNYADFAEEDDEAGVVLKFELSPTANILDMRDEADWETWKQYANQISDKNLYRKLVKAGIDGLYDRSFDGVVVYNPKVLTLVSIEKVEQNG